MYTSTSKSKFAILSHPKLLFPQFSPRQIPKPVIPKSTMMSFHLDYYKSFLRDHSVSTLAPPEVFSAQQPGNLSKTLTIHGLPLLYPQWVSFTLSFSWPMRPRQSAPGLPLFPPPLPGPPTLSLAPFSSHTNLFALSSIYQSRSYLMAFVHAVASAWTILPPDSLMGPSSLTLFKCLCKCEHPN